MADEGPGTCDNKTTWPAKECYKDSAVRLPPPPATEKKDKKEGRWKEKRRQKERKKERRKERKKKERKAEIQKNRKKEILKEKREKERKEGKTFKSIKYFGMGNT